MTAHVSSSDAFCTFTFLDCFATQTQDHLQTEDITRNDGTLKRATITHDQQPHLVEPMKLTLYEELPCTPLSAHHEITTPQPFFSRAMTASRASSRASFFSLKRIVSRQSLSISKPIPYAMPENDLPLRRGRNFRPLELSIYMDHHRLSDLPEFDRFSFTDFGDLKNLGAILSRPQSVAFPPTREVQPFRSEDVQKPTSMFEMGSLLSGRPPTSYSIVSDLRPQTSHSVLSASRPPSEYDALHSHPVSWASLPGLTLSTQNLKQDKPVAILTPMAEEFPPDTTVVTVDGTVLTFPADAAGPGPAVVDIPLPSVHLAAPAPVVSRGSYHAPSSSKSLDDDGNTSSSGRIRHGHKRSLSQWLASRARSSSTSSVATISTTRSFAEHRRKRSQFYQLGHQAQMPSISGPRPLRLADRNQTSSSETLHHRTTTVSTFASTVDTDVLSDEYHTARTIEDTQRQSAAVEGRARSGTFGNITSPSHGKIATSTVKELGFATPVRGQVYIVNNDDDEHVTPYLDEIGGRLHTAGVGVAF